MNVGRPLVFILVEMETRARSILHGVPAAAWPHLPHLLNLQSELNAWKGVTRFAEWILLGALVSLASGESGGYLPDWNRFTRIAEAARGLVERRIAELQNARAAQ